jgi:hypothetical protein
MTALDQKQFCRLRLPFKTRHYERGESVIMNTTAPNFVFRALLGFTELTQIKAPYTRVYPGLRRGTALLCLGMVVSILLLGLRMPYYNKAASDMVSIYEALSTNSGLPHEFLVYPSIIGRRLLGWWLVCLHALGFISISKLEQLPFTTDIVLYERSWQALVEAGRVFSLGIGIACVVSFIALVRRWIGIWQIAVLAGIALAFSSGYALGFRILRPEMMAASFVFSALLLVFLAAQDTTDWRFAKLTAAGFLVALAIIEKVQSIIPALAILPLAVAFGKPWLADKTPVTSRPLLGLTLLVMLSLLALWPAVAILRLGMDEMLVASATPYKALSHGISGRYQIVIAVAIVATMAGYANLWRVPLRPSLAAVASVGLGLSLGFDLLYLQQSVAAIVAVANPIEHLQFYSAGDGAMVLYQSPWAIFQTVFRAIGKSFAIHTFVFAPTHRPTLLLEWLAWAGAYVAFRSNRKLMALQIVLLLGCSIAQDAMFSLRQVKVYYLPYSDPPIILAAALALSQFKAKIMMPIYQRAAVCLIVVYVIWGHAQPALAVYSRHNRGKVCGIVTQFTKRIAIPYCRDAPGGGMMSIYEEL